MKIIGNMFLTLLMAVVLGTGLMILVYALPVERMRGHVKNSMGMLTQEGDRYSWAAGHPYATLDGYTDALMLNTATYRGSGSLLRDAMTAPHIAYDISKARPRWWQTEALTKALDEGTLPEGDVENYSRYWHGYLLYLKPLLLFMDVGGIRAINLLIQALLALTVLLKVFEKIGKPYSYAFAAALLFINPISTALCFQFSSVYYVVLVSSLIALSKNDWLKDKGRYYYLFLLNGICVAYFDLLTYPFAALGIPTVVYLLLNVRLSLGEKVAAMVKLGLAWGFGYLGMWASKWVMASLLTGNNVIAEGVDVLISRLYGSDESTGGQAVTWAWALTKLLNNDTSIVNSSAGMWSFFRLSVILLGVLLLAAVLVLAYLCATKRAKAADILPLSLACAYPFVWYAVVQNHSILHHFFTYRGLSVSVFAALCIAIHCTWKRERNRTGGNGAGYSDRHS